MDKDLIMDPRYQWAKSEVDLLDLVNSKYSDQLPSGIVVVSTKDYKPWGKEARGKLLRSYDRKSGKLDPIVVVPSNSNSRTKVHEITHRRSALKSSKDWYDTVDSVVTEEIEAELASYLSKGKEASWTVFDSAISNAVRQGYRPAEIMGAVTRYLERTGREYKDRDIRSWVWTRIQYYYKKWKGRK